MVKMNYGDKVVLDLNVPVEYPDFTVEFLGEEKRDVGVEWNKSGDKAFTYYKYKVKSGDYENEILWGSGTGLIVPQKFTVNGKSFSLTGHNKGFQVLEG
jgi:hypothetical protein